MEWFCKTENSTSHVKNSLPSSPPVRSTGGVGTNELEVGSQKLGEALAEFQLSEGSPVGPEP